MRDCGAFGRETSLLACGCSLTQRFTSQHTKSKWSSVETGRLLFRPEVVSIRVVLLKLACGPTRSAGFESVFGGRTVRRESFVSRNRIN